MKRKRLTWLALVPLTTVTLGGRPTPTPEIIDSGTFTIYLDGERVGEEQFVIREDRGGDAGPIYRAGGQLNLKLKNRTMRVRVGFEGTGPKCRLRRYEAEISGTEATTVVAETQGDRIGLKIRSPGGEEMKEFLLRGETAVLDLNVAHHYFFALKLLGDARSTSAYILVPRTRTQQKVTIVDRGQETTQVAGRAMELRHVTLTDESGAVHHIWARGDKVFKVEVPTLHFVAERVPGESGAGSR